MSRIPWRDRIARASQLAENIPSAAEVMRFHQALLVEQESWCRPGELSGALIEDRFPRLLDFLGRKASPELAAEARAIAAAGPPRWESIIYGYWAGGGSPGDEFFARAFLAPYAEAVCAEPAGARARYHHAVSLLWAQTGGVRASTGVRGCAAISGMLAVQLGVEVPAHPVRVVPRGELRRPPGLFGGGVSARPHRDLQKL
jgi:hypothetical protein